MRYPIVTQTAEAGTSSWVEFRCCYSITDPGYCKEQKAAVCTLLVFQCLGSTRKLVFWLNKQEMWNYKWCRRLKSSSYLNDMRVVSENATWCTSGIHTSHFPKFRGKLSKIRKCSSVSEEVFERYKKKKQDTVELLKSAPNNATFN